MDMADLLDAWRRQVKSEVKRMSSPAQYYQRNVWVTKEKEFYFPSELTTDHLNRIIKFIQTENYLRGMMDHFGNIYGPKTKKIERLSAQQFFQEWIERSVLFQALLREQEYRNRKPEPIPEPTPAPVNLSTIRRQSIEEIKKKIKNGAQYGSIA